MINIIPRPYSLIDYEKRIRVNGFDYDCPKELSTGLEILKEEQSNLTIKRAIKRYEELLNQKQEEN